jgi:hypothetical protein
MIKNSIYVLILFTVLFVSSFSSQNTCTVENYYLNSNIFNNDTIYNDVLIDGKHFKISVLSDKLDEYLEKIEFSEDKFQNDSPKTIIIYDNSNGKIAYAKKFDSSIPSFVKQNGDLSKEGKLYLHWMSHGGGSGFSSNTNLVYLENGKIKITTVFKSREIDYVLFNKNDKEIYLLQGLYGDELDEDGSLIESHFSDHRCQVIQYHFGHYGYDEQKIGITKNKYSSGGTTGKSALEILQDIIDGEIFMPSNTIISDYKEFNNFDGKILSP